MSEPDLEAVLTSHERRLTTLDPLLPARHPLPPRHPGEPVLTAPGGVALARRQRYTLDNPGVLWGLADQYQLLPRVGEQRPVAAMAGLLRQWPAEVRARAVPGDQDSVAALTWPSRDAAMTRLFLSCGLVPSAVVAARPARREPPAPADPPPVRVRPAHLDDLAELTALTVDLVRWDSQFGALVERPTTAPLLHDELQGRLRRDQPWILVAEVRGRLAGLLTIEPPQDAAWIAPSTSAGPVAYLGSMVVAASHRGEGVGACLVRHGHAALDRAGARLTLLHYAALSPVSGPFWHRCGYRPLWTVWQARPASGLRVTSW